MEQALPISTPKFNAQSSITSSGHARKARVTLAASMWVIAAGFSASLFAQTTAGTLTGSVNDPSGAIVPDATVLIKELSTGTVHKAATNSAGIYTTPQLTPGTYSITVTKEGFSTTTRTGVPLEINQVANVNITLAVGSVGQTVEVRGDVPLLQTDNVSLGTVLVTKQISDLPLNGRQFSQLLELAPGVVPVSVGQSLTPSIGTGSIDPGVNGQTNRANLTFIDNILTTDNLFSSFTINPSIDAIQSFQVQSHAVDAQYGESTGGTFNIATKSGTNEFHGNAYEFFRNQALDAVNYFAKSNSQFSLNDFGGTLGGPVVKNKLFLFGYYEGVRQTQSATNQTILPTPEELGGDFSALLPTTQIYDPATYNAATHAIQPFAGNIIPTSRLNQGILQTIAAYVPTIPAGSPANAINYTNTTSGTVTQNQWGLRGDYTLSPKDLFYARFIKNAATTFSPVALPNNGFLEAFNDKNLSIDYVRSPSSSLTMQVSGGLNFFAYPQYYQQANAQSVFDAAGFAAGFTSTPGNIGAPYVPGINPSGFFSLQSGWGGQGQNDQNLYQVLGSVSKQAGRHALKFGGAFYWSSEVGNFSQDEVNFNQQATWSPCASLNMGSCVGSGGNSLASLLLGLPTSASRQLGSALNDVRNHVFGLYAQDSWKVTPKLSISYGLRWDVTTPPTESENRFSSFDIHTGTWVISKGNIATPSTLPAGVVISSSHSITHSDYKNVSPRLGFNYLIGPKTSILAGAGVFFDNWAGVTQGAQNARGSWPNGADQTVNNVNIAGITAGSTAQNPFGTLAPVIPTSPYPSGGTFLDPDFKDAYSWQWNLELQQQLNNTSVVSFAYVGSSTSRVPISRPANASRVLGPTRNIPFPQMSQLSSLESTGHLKYNALQVKYEERAGKGLTVTGALTWSHAIDVGCSDLFVNCNIQNAYDLKQEEADSSIDVPIVFTTSALYELPFGKDKPFLASGLASAIVGGFQVNALVIARQGTPFTPSINFDNANANGGSQRPNLIGDPNAGPHNLTEFFNRAAFAVAAPYSFGSAGRNSLRGPRYTDFDLSLFRTFQSFRNEQLQLRAEAFNAANHPQFSNPDGTLEDATFGQITSAGSPREIQLAAKYTF